MSSGEQLLSFHVYRIGCLLGDNKIIKAHDKVTVLYYLKAKRADTQWQFALHAGGPSGTLICQVESGYIGPPTIYDLSLGPILVNIVSEHQLITVERHRNAPEGSRWFQGPDDKQYHWRSSYFWRNGMECLDTEGEIVATYRATAMAITKDGELRIYPSGRFMTDLLVATSLAMRMPSN